MKKEQFHAEKYETEARALAGESYRIVGRRGKDRKELKRQAHLLAFRF